MSSDGLRLHGYPFEDRDRRGEGKLLGKILELDPEVKDAVFEMPATIEITSQ